MLIQPNIDVVVTKRGGHDMYGQEMPGREIKSRCSIVKLLSGMERTSVRTDSSASKGSAHESVSDAVLLFPPDIDIEFGDKVTLAVTNTHLKIIGIFPRHDVVGRLDHLQVTAVVWA